MHPIDIFEKRVQHDRLVAYARDKRDKRWKEKTKHSPFGKKIVGWIKDGWIVCYLVGCLIGCLAGWIDG